MDSMDDSSTCMDGATLSGSGHDAATQNIAKFIKWTFYGSMVLAEHT